MSLTLPLPDSLTHFCCTWGHIICILPACWSGFEPTGSRGQVQVIPVPRTQRKALMFVATHVQEGLCAYVNPNCTVRSWSVEVLAAGHKAGPRREMEALFSADLYTTHQGASKSPEGPPQATYCVPEGQSGCRGVSPDVHCLPALLSHAKAHQVLRAYRRGLGPSSARGSEVSPAWP